MPDNLQGTLQLSRLEVNSAALPGGSKTRRTASLRNSGPITDRTG